MTEGDGAAVDVTTSSEIPRSAIDARPTAANASLISTVDVGQRHPGPVQRRTMAPLGWWSRLESSGLATMPKATTSPRGCTSRCSASAST
jgi:hypothetical protein